MPIRQRIEMNADTAASASEIVDGLVSKGQFNKQEVIATLQLMSEKNMGVWFKESEDLLYFV
jgi:polyhydroxyalkanoate synthesis regulator phasin